MSNASLLEKVYHFGDVELRLLEPAPADLAAGAGGAAVYWGRLWPAARALASFIAANPALVAGASVLELAAGLGLPGLVAAGHARRVVLSDIVSEAVALMAQSAALNRLVHVECRRLDWNALPEAAYAAEVLLLSDVNYAPEAFAPLLTVLKRFLTGGTTILLATPQRLLAKPFIEQLLPYCVAQAEEAVSGYGEGPVYVSVLVLRGGRRYQGEANELPPLLF